MQHLINIFLNEFNICETWYETLKFISLLHIYSSTNLKKKKNQTCILITILEFILILCLTGDKYVLCSHHRCCTSPICFPGSTRTSLPLSGSVLCGFIIHIYDVHPTWSAVYSGVKCNADRHHSDCHCKNLLQGCRIWKSQQKTTYLGRDAFEKTRGG